MAYKKGLKDRIKILLASVAFTAFFLLTTTQVIASSTYVLPYPPAMPGGTSYKFHKFYEFLSQYKYFGDLGRFKYNLKYSDKYLVEAKTLFEYQQYLLGYQALKKSNDYFEETSPNLQAALRAKKDISEKRIILSQAAKKHIEVLQLMKSSTPAIFNWQPEKSNPTALSIHALIDESINLRNIK